MEITVAEFLGLCTTTWEDIRIWNNELEEIVCEDCVENISCGEYQNCIVTSFDIEDGMITLNIDCEV